MTRPKTAMLHYTSPPVVGEVETVIQAHTRAFCNRGFPVAVVAGWGDKSALAPGTEWIWIPELDLKHPRLVDINSVLTQGRMAPGFETMTQYITESLARVLRGYDNLIVHNAFTRHVNLPLTAALHILLDAGLIGHCIAWCHDLSWTSPVAQSRVYPDYPWDLLRTRRPDVTYVAVSRRIRQELAGLFECPPEQIELIYNGVDPQVLLGLSDEGYGLVGRLNLFQSDLNLLMPVRITQAKNIEFALRVTAALKGMGIRPKLVVTGPPNTHDPESMTYFKSLQSLRRALDVEEEARFVFESGPDPDHGMFIKIPAVGDLYRACDVMFMPSHREGFGMPVLEAGLAGIPAVCTNSPAADEIGGQDVVRFDANQEPAELAAHLLAWSEGDAVHRLRRRVRQAYTWETIFDRQIEPLLRG